MWSYPPVVSENGYVGSVTYWEYSGEVTIYDASLYPNTMVAFPLTNLPRTTVYDADNEYWWFGGLANGSQIQPGNYVYVFPLGRSSVYSNQIETD